MKRIMFFTLGIIVLLSLPEIAHAQDREQLRQDFLRQLDVSGIANYYYARDTDITMHVSVWGIAGRSGLYEVPVGMHIGRLLSLAGGPGGDIRGFDGPGLGGRRTTDRGKTVVRLSRLKNGEREIIMRLEIEDLLQLDEQSLVLEDGDIVMIDQVRPFRFWDALAITSSIAAIVLLIDRFVPLTGD